MPVLTLLAQALKACFACRIVEKQKISTASLKIAQARFFSTEDERMLGIFDAIFARTNKAVLRFDANICPLRNRKWMCTDLCDFEEKEGLDGNTFSFPESQDTALKPSI